MNQSGNLHANKGSKALVWIFLLLVIILLALIIADLFIGTVKIPFSRIPGILAGSDRSDAVLTAILFDFRIPKTITAILAGAALSISGLQMQTIFRNPLAGPDVLGVSSGASLGVALIVLGFGEVLLSDHISMLGSWIQIVAAWIGAGFVLFLIMVVSLRVKDIMTILILGILFGAATSALVSIMQYFSPQSHLKAFVVWSMGNLGSLTTAQLKVLSVCICLGLLISLFTTKMMNTMLLGETYSKSMGVNVKFARLLIFLSTSILSGSITAFCGPLAFVGIAVPHLARLIFHTANHYILVPATIILGSILLLVSDILSQLPGSGVVLPINSVTAILGIPVVIWVIVYNRRFSGIN